MSSLWAVPSAADAAMFQREIDRLAGLADGPRFAPHVTLLGSVPDEPALYADAVAATAAFEVDLVDLADSDERFKCVTLTAGPAPELFDLRVRLAAAVAVDASGYEPHLSLAYGELPSDRRAALRSAVDVPLPHRTTIAAVWLVDTSNEDAERWQPIERWTLDAGARP